MLMRCRLAGFAPDVAKRPSHVDTDILIDGLEQARGRFASSTPGTAESFHAAFEVLAWVAPHADLMMLARLPRAVARARAFRSRPTRWRS